VCLPEATWTSHSGNTHQGSLAEDTNLCRIRAVNKEMSDDVMKSRTDKPLSLFIALIEEYEIKDSLRRGMVS
jgi:hypothetical protein